MRENMKRFTMKRITVTLITSVILLSGCSASEMADLKASNQALTQENNELTQKNNKLTSEKASLEARNQYYHKLIDDELQSEQTDNAVYVLNKVGYGKMQSISRNSLGESGSRGIFEDENIYTFTVSNNDNYMAVTYLDENNLVSTLKLLDTTGKLIKEFPKTDFEDKNFMDVSHLNISFPRFTQNGEWIVCAISTDIDQVYPFTINVKTLEVTLYTDSQEWQKVSKQFVVEE